MEQEFETTIHNLLIENKTSEALRLIHSYLSQHSFEADSYYWLGMAYLFDRKYECALSAFEQGDRLNPRDSDILFGLGVVNIALGRSKEGVDYLKQLDMRYPAGKHEIMEKASMLSSAGMHLAAIKYIFTADIMMNGSEEDASELSKFRDDLFDDYIEYTLTKTPALFENRLWLENVDIRSEYKLKEFLRELINKDYMKDALYFYFSRCKKSCEFGTGNCGKDEDCLFCLCDYAFDTEIMDKTYLLVELLRFR